MDVQGSAQQGNRPGVMLQHDALLHLSCCAPECASYGTSASAGVYYQEPQYRNMLIVTCMHWFCRYFVFVLQPLLELL